MLALEIENAVPEPLDDGKSQSNKIDFNKIAIDFVKTLMAKLESDEYVLTPIEELIFLKLLDMAITKRDRKKGEAKKSFYVYETWSLRKEIKMNRKNKH
jgi:hypothetical protein